MTAEIAANAVRVRRLGVDTYREPVVFMRADCAPCRAEGFRALSRVQLTRGARQLIATLNVVTGDFLEDNEAGLSEIAWSALGAEAGDLVQVSHPEPVESFSAVRAKLYGRRFSDAALGGIVQDISAGRYSSIEIAAFVTACAGDSMSSAETLGLTRAMVNAGTRLTWTQAPILDKHCVGGLPGNRTTPIVVAIVAACGLTIPKTSSRAITSPAGTADTMEVLAPVDLTLEHMRRVVEREGGCVVWGGAMALSPADDILIQIERPLDFDSEGQLAASVISKKIAAGSTHLVIDLPVGPTTKLRSAAAAAALAQRLSEVGTALGLQLRVVHSDGSQPVGRGIGPALEARDVLAVLRREPEAPLDLRERALVLAAELLAMASGGSRAEALPRARAVLDSGQAWSKFLAICEAQGGFREPTAAHFQRELTAPRAGTLSAVDNRRLARLAKLAGAPLSASAGLTIHARLGERVERGQPLLTLHARSPGELEYAAAYAAAHPHILLLGETP
jgi:thymidine phosphorylase